MITAIVGSLFTIQKGVWSAFFYIIAMNMLQYEWERDEYDNEYDILSK